MLIIAFFNKERASRAILQFIAALLFGVLAMASFNIVTITCVADASPLTDIVCEIHSFIDEPNAWIFGSFGTIAILLSIANIFIMLTSKDQE